MTHLKTRRTSKYGQGKKFPDKISIGIEIREKVASYVDQRIKALRAENKDKEHFQNIAVVRTNAMKCIANFFAKGALEKLFFCFADPHFKVPALSFCRLLAQLLQRSTQSDRVPCQKMSKKLV